MSGRNICLFFAFAVLFPVLVSAASIDRTDVKIALDDNEGAYWEVTILYSHYVQRSDYFVLAQVADAKVYVNGTEQDCSVVRESIGYSIICDRLAAKKITYTFTTPGVVASLNEFSYFNYRFPVTDIVNNFSVRIDLPLGTAIAEEFKLSVFGIKPFEPLGASQGSDGRVIYLSWLFEPQLGDSIYTSVYYETIGQNQDQVQQLVAIVILVGVVAVIVILFLHSRKGTAKDMLPVLTEPERLVMKILLRENKDVDQRTIVKELDYSKSKISRVVSELVSRGLIEKVPKGRTNLLRLKKITHKQEKALKTEEEKKKEETIKKLLGKDENKK